MSDPKHDSVNAQPAKRRTRGPNKPGPNKPKPGAIEVRTEAVMAQAEIVKLLAAHAAEQLGTGAAGMELQINTGNGWTTPSDVPPHGAIIRFATAKAAT
jgi:hypothetical protein